MGRRTREFGLRAALGARPAQVRALVLRGSVGVAGLGMGTGLLGAWALTRSLSDLLFEVGTADVTTYAAVGGILAASVVVASYVPARRATRVAPTVALNDDCRC